MSTDEFPADPVSPLGYRLQGAVVTAFLFMGALSLGGLATARNAAPPEPPLVFRGVDDGSITVEDLVDESEPFMRKAIDAECPWGTRWAAHKLCRWWARTHIKLGIARHGHQIAGALKVVEPLSNTLFKPEPAARIRGLRRLCEIPVEELGPVAVEVREAAGPMVEMGR